MEHQALKDTLYAGIHALAENRRYYHHSAVGSDYSRWTDEGILAVTEYTKIMVELMLAEEERSLNKRAKDLVIRGLKGETV
jgi:predicted GIY-YIG superfamily endonuclease